MNPLRCLGLFALVFAFSMSVMHVYEHGIPSLAVDEFPADKDEPEDKDDPVVDVYCLKG